MIEMETTTEGRHGFEVKDDIGANLKCGGVGSACVCVSDIDSICA